MATSDSTNNKSNKAIRWNVDTGRIRVDANSGVVFGATGVQLKPTEKSPNGYLMIGLQKSSGGQISVYHHRVIAYAVWGDVIFQKGLEINHINEVKSDNRIVNLELVTSSQNKFHSSYRHYGKHGNKITEDDVREIRKLRAAGVYLNDIAAQYGISFSLVSQIARNVIWMRVK